MQALRGEASTFRFDWMGHVFDTRVEPLRDRRDRIVGTLGLSFDVTEQARTAEALRLSEAHLRRLVESNVIGIVLWDARGSITEANEAFLQLLGFTHDELIAEKVSWRAMTPPEYTALDDRALDELRTNGRCAPYEKEYVAKDGTRVPVLIGAATFERSSDGADVDGVAFILDLREQVQLRAMRDRLLATEQRARLETEVANARLLLLVEGSKRLSRTMTAGDAIATLAAVVVPGLADWSYVVYRGTDGGPELVHAVHGDPNKQSLLAELRAFPSEPAAPEGAARVFRTGEAVLYSDITDDQLMPMPPAWPIVGTRDPGHLHVVRELGMRALLCVPIRGRNGASDGVLSLVSAHDPRRYDAEDVLLAQDLAGRAAVSLENARLLAEALDSVRARDDFLAVAAHELRTPLTSLLLQVQLLGRTLRREPFDAAAGWHHVSAAENNARRLAGLVDRLLDVSRLAQHRMPIRLEDIDLVPLLRRVLAALANDVEAGGCTLEATMPESVTGCWDGARIEQVLTNLMSNAIKFGAGKPIEVALTATATQAQLTIRDHGIGISREDQARIFGRFERAVSTRHFGGLGLGLYVSAHILRAHHGALRVDSEPGQGACFTVELPRGNER